MTDDQIDGNDAEDRKGRVLGIEPWVKYDVGSFSLIGKAYFETLARNRNESVSSLPQAD